jgi:lysophospholipase L1-like esterase
VRALAAFGILLVACSRAASTAPDRMSDSSFSRYVALGDSISIDVYPAHDAARRGLPASTEDLGAASLLYRNDDNLWPEFRGRDLRSRFKGIEFTDLTADGATTHSLLNQVERLGKNDERTLVTITIGGNDLLSHIGWAGGNPAPEIAERTRTAVARVLEQRPNSIVILTNVYDPSDGTNRLPGYARRLDRESEWLRDYNERLRALAAADERIRYADIRSHFHGHGVSAPEEQWWYLRESIIEPGARGASEVRRVWLQSLDATNAHE